MPDKVSWTHHYAGDRTIVLEFGQFINKATVDRIVALNRLISAEQRHGKLIHITETIPTFRSLAIMYDPLQVHPDELLEQLQELGDTPLDVAVTNQRRWRIPVHYGGDFGPDLSDVASLTHLDEDEVVALHEGCEFTVYMLGFLPGFAFLGDTPEALHLPRRTEPRVRVPAGSVAIAMQLTGVYPWDSPGGWHILGNSPIALFDGHLDPPALFRAGDAVTFAAIDRDEHQMITEQVSAGTFERSTLQLTDTTVATRSPGLPPNDREPPEDTQSSAPVG